MYIYRLNTPYSDIFTLLVLSFKWTCTVVLGHSDIMVVLFVHISVSRTETVILR